MYKCLICKKNNRFVSITKLPNMPASAQNLPTKDELSTEKGVELELVQCLNCGLVQFNCTPVDYYKDVIRAGGGTTTMKNLRISQYKDFIDTFNLNGKKIIEIGSGRGEFLQFLSEFDVKAYGIENNEALIDYARNKGLNVQKGFADGNLGILADGPFDAFLSFNFLEHQPDPNEMIQDIYKNLTDEGVGLVTVPSLEYILNNDSYYEFIRDHIAYYSFDTLRLLFNNNGFEVVKEEIVNRDTLSIYVKKRKIHDFSNLLINSEKINIYIEKLLNEYFDKKIAVWGASHQGFTLVSTTKLKDKIEYIIDSSDFKQGKYAPASHVKIIHPNQFFDNPVDAIIIVAPGYTNEIKDIIREKYGQDVKIYCLKSNNLEELI